MARTNSHTQKKFGKTRLIRYKRTNVWRSVEKTTLVLYELTYREKLRQQSCIKQATNLSHFTGNKEICLQNFSSFLVFGHHVRPYGEIGRTISKFGRTMSDDRLLFPALIWKIFIAINNFKVVTRFMGLFPAFVNVQCVPIY